MKGGIEKIGVWSFIAGLVIAAVTALIAGSISSTVVWVLGILGIVVGLINISDKEVNMYLIASIALMLGVSSFSEVIQAVGVGVASLTNFLYAITVFVAPGAVVVGIKAIFEVAKSK